MKKLLLGLTEFAIPSPLRGSIETYSGYGRLPDVGQQIHLEIQEQRAREFPSYEAEKWITHDFSHRDHTISVSGRMDGFCSDPVLWIEEIKSAYDIDKLRAKIADQEDHPYKRQLLTYGYFHWLETGDEPHLRFCLVNSRDHSEEFMDIALDIPEYEAWLARRLDDIVEKEKLFEAARKRRKKNAAVIFPFADQRPGQKELMDTISSNLKKGGRMLLQAPTGLGKTMGVTLPTLQDSLSRGQKLIYLTAKNSQHSVAEDAVERLQNSGADIRALSLLSKRKMCFKEEVMCDPHYCEYAKDHYTKMADNDLSGKLLKKKNLNEKSLKLLAEKYEVCPFELQMESTAFVDVVIGDYNYVFSPYNVRERLSKNSLGKSSSLPNLVVDEAHNLPGRAADYFSAQLTMEALQQLLMSVSDLSAEIHELAERLYARGQDFFAKILESLDGQRGPKVITLAIEELDPLRELMAKLLNMYLQSDQPLRAEDPVIQFHNQLVNFADLLENHRDEFSVIYEGTSTRHQQVKIFCSDAAWWLKASYEDFANVIAFSATLKPFEYYRELLGLGVDETLCSEFETPFPKENRKILVVPQVSTKLRDRAANVSKIKSGIEKIVAVQPGNYFVFFPSFDFLEKVAVGLEIPGFEMIRQHRNMERSQIEGVFERLKEKNKPVVIFAVQGGVFSEGVDYPGDALIGAIIVGPALPAFNFERELVRQFYDKKFGHGFNYAYTFPAMARTIQSAGRVIRSAQDRGLIVLMDRRFLEPTYVASMPKDWVEDNVGSLESKSILSDLQAFWNLKNEDDTSGDGIFPDSGALSHSDSP